jgi:hypothetical protein
VRFTWKILTSESIFHFILLGAFPDDASFLVLLAYSQHVICPGASQASVVIKPESWTRAAVDSATRNLIVQSRFAKEYEAIVAL